MGVHLCRQVGNDHFGVWSLCLFPSDFANTNKHTRLQAPLVLFMCSRCITWAWLRAGTRRSLVCFLSPPQLFGYSRSARRNSTNSMIFSLSGKATFAHSFLASQIWLCIGSRSRPLQLYGLSKCPWRTLQCWIYCYVVQFYSSFLGTRLQKKKKKSSFFKWVNHKFTTYTI